MQSRFQKKTISCKNTVEYLAREDIVNNTNHTIPMKFKKLSIVFSLFLSLVSAHTVNAWQTDFTKALEEATENNKPVLINFTGSDWCGWCIKLDEEVFSQDAFQQFADNNLVLVEIDFPRKKEQPEGLKVQNEELAEKYGIRGFPTILVLSSDGKLIGKTGYKNGGAEAYVTHIKEIIGE